MRATAASALATGALRALPVGDVVLLTVPTLERLRAAGHEDPESTVSGKLIVRGVRFIDYRGTVW